MIFLKSLWIGTINYLQENYCPTQHFWEKYIEGLRRKTYQITYTFLKNLNGEELVIF